MAILKPFLAFRPTPALVDQVAALPYDVMDRWEAKEMAKGNPYSFLHVDKAEINFSDLVDPYDPKIYQKAKDQLYQMIEDGVYEQDLTSSLYIYRLTMDGRSQTGLVGCVPIDDYLNNKIKKHELTRADKEQDRIRHVDTCNAQTGPIFLTYPQQDLIDILVEKSVKKQEPVYNFISSDGVRHEVWHISEQEDITQLQEEFLKVPNLYIADGHHRAASAVQVGIQRRRENPNYTGEEEYNFFLGVLFPHNQLKILDYNRVVKDLNGLTEQEFIKFVEDVFNVKKWEETSPYQPTRPHTFGMYLKDSWYVLEAKDRLIDSTDPVASLDVSVLQQYLLGPILGIQDPRTDERIDFIGGIRGLEELERRVKQDMTVAFSLYPTSIEELIQVADADQLMPPKSTWFEPKLRSGIFVHVLDE
ncbi:MAG: DUF1015 domain-containing protein [Epulopiscium sp.]|nr:DUF1015 domain-containing protein [Candidatus Epulonipiscium sp.]